MKHAFISIERKEKKALLSFGFLNFSIIAFFYLNESLVATFSEKLAQTSRKCLAEQGMGVVK